MKYYVADGMTDDSVATWITRCRTGTVEEQCQALMALVAAEAGAAVPAIIALLQAPAPVVRANVAHALGRLGRNAPDSPPHPTDSANVIGPALLPLFQQPLFAVAAARG